jgi:transposase-like protein
MKRRHWDSKTKAKVVLEGLTGKPVSEICNQYQISQNQYYQWRDKFLSESHRAFEGKEDGAEVSRLKAKAQRLQQIIGALTVELKKSEDELL